MLRKIRIILASIFFLGITLLFLDFTGTLHAWLGWMAKIQFLPAVLALNVAVIVILVALTLVFGRVYCSVICPMGVMQDVVSGINGLRKKKKYRFTWSPEKKILRYTVLAIFIVALVAGIGSLVALLAPYSSYGRIVQNLFAPLYQWANNGFAYLSERAESYAFYKTDVWLRSLPTFIIAAATFIFVVILAWRNGRTYCNTICPVGTFLSFISRFSIFRPVIDGDKCKNCGLCTKRCKASCIDFKNHKIDYSRCVACMDCIDTCKNDALHYKLYYGRKTEAPESEKKEKGQTAANEKVDNGLRSVLAATAMLAGTSIMKAQNEVVDGGIAAIEKKKAPHRQTRLVPPGAKSIWNLARHCTACQLCVSQCPNGVLRPSTGLMNLMQPEMSYERGYCRPECTICSEVCPTGAISRITVEEKTSIQIGHAVWIKDNCVPLRDGVECGNCARHCPSGAIQMVPSDSSNPESVKIPVVNEERCIGCGTCENLCPARPFSAIYVEGHETHRVI